MLSDAHLHFHGYTEEEVAQVVARAQGAGVELILAVGMSLETSQWSAQVASKFGPVYAAVGIHPWWAVAIDDELYGALREVTNQPKAVALSEIGLDFARDPATRDLQVEALRRQLQLARERGLPVLVHCREAHPQMLEILCQEGIQEIGGAVHGFSGDEAMLQDWLNLGFYISIGRAITMAEASGLRETIKKIPSDRLLTETDSAPPALLRSVAPQPQAQAPRPTSEPTQVRQVAASLAELRGGTVEEMGSIATTNLRRLLKI